MVRLQDDGRTVTLDLHGERVEDALRLAGRALALAAARGRRRLDLVHGRSTTDAAGARRTIKRALHDWLDGRPPGVVAATRADAVATLHLSLTTRPDPRPVALRDLLG